MNSNVTKFENLYGRTSWLLPGQAACHNKAQQQIKTTGTCISIKAMLQ